MKRTLDYGNCVDCGYYGCLNHNRRCRACAEHEQLSLDSALDVIKKNPRITADELAERLDVENGKVYEWMSKGLVRCTATQFDCPNCGTSNLNRFSCFSCGFEPTGASKAKEPPRQPAGPRRMVFVNSRKSA